MVEGKTLAYVPDFGYTEHQRKNPLLPIAKPKTNMFKWVVTQNYKHHARYRRSLGMIIHRCSTVFIAGKETCYNLHTLRAGRIATSRYLQHHTPGSDG
jgi:hypothetical protein